MLPGSGAGLVRLPLPRIVERCSEESTLYARQAAHDPSFCFELFRRAIVERDQGAWEALYIQYTGYTPVVRRWVERHGSFSATGEDVDFFINRAFERMWTALTPARFAAFPDLAALLRYLKLCVHSAITDYLRAQPTAMELNEESEVASIADDDQGDPAAGDLWPVVAERLHDERERTAVYARYILELKPNEIANAYPGFFPDVHAVYAVLQNVLKRLRRDAALRTYLAGVA